MGHRVGQSLNRLTRNRVGRLQTVRPLNNSPLTLIHPTVFEPSDGRQSRTVFEPSDGRQSRTVTNRQTLFKPFSKIHPTVFEPSDGRPSPTVSEPSDGRPRLTQKLHDPFYYFLIAQNPEMSCSFYHFQY